MFCVIDPTAAENNFAGLYSRLLKTERGDIFIDGINISKLKPATKKLHIYKLHQGLSVYRYGNRLWVEPIIHRFSAPSSSDQRIAEAGIEKVGIKHLADKPILRSAEESVNWQWLHGANNS